MVIKAKQRYYFTLFSFMAVLGFCVVYGFTSAGEIQKFTSQVLLALFFSIGIPLLFVLAKEKAHDWRVLAANHEVQGRITSIEANSWLNASVIIHYTYKVNGKEYEGSAWTTIQYLDQVPAEGSQCRVLYDEKNPQRSVVDNLLIIK